MTCFSTIALSRSAAAKLPRLPQPDQVIEGVWASDPFQACNTMAVRERRFGDVALVMRISMLAGKRKLTIDVRASRGLGGPYERCVRAALPTQQLAPLAQLADPGDGFERNVVLGEIRPLLPDKAALLPAWQEIAQAGESASRSQRLKLRELVGPDVELNRNGCLLVADTPGMQRSVELWLRASGRETSPFWRDVSISLPTLLGSREPPHTRGMAIFVLNDAWTVSYDYGFARVRPPQPDSLCLVELTAGRKQAVLSAMIKATRCQLTDAADALTWPRPILPSLDAKSIAAAEGRICAVDSHGKLICCGKAGPDPLLAHAKASALSDQRDYGCAIDSSGQASCWGQEDGSGRTRPPRGAFRAIESAPTYSCAIDERTKVTCWGALNSSAPSPYTTVRDRWNASLDRQRNHH